MGLRRLLCLLCVVALSVFAHATVTVTATLGMPTGGPAPYAFLQFDLKNCGYNVPVVPSSPFAMVVQSIRFTPSQLPATIYANNEITCGNVYSTLWHVTAYKDANTPIAGDFDYAICSASSTVSYCPSSSGSWNLTTAQPFSGNPPPPGFNVIFANPIQSQQIIQPQGTLMTFYGKFTFTSGVNLGPITFANLAGLAGVTNVVVVSDATLGSSPCAGGGTGALAVYYNGQWNCSGGGGSGGGGGTITGATTGGGLVQTGTTLGMRLDCLPGQIEIFGGTTWNCGNVGANSIVTFSSPVGFSVSFTVLSGATATIDQCRDTTNGTAWVPMEPEIDTFNPSTGVETWTWLSGATGECTINYAGGAGLSGNITVSGVSTQELESVLFPDQFPGADCGARIASAQTFAAGSPVEYDINQACGLLWTTAVNITAPQQVIRFIQPGTYVTSAPITLSGWGDAIYGPPCVASIDLGGHTCPVSIQAAVNSNLAELVTLSGTDDAIENITLDGNCNWTATPLSSCTNNLTAGDGLYITGLRDSANRVHAWRFTVNGVHIFSALSANGAAGFSMNNSMLGANGNDGVYVQNTSDTLFETNNQIENNGGSGVEVFGGAGNRFGYGDFGGNGNLAGAPAFYCHGRTATGYKICEGNIVEANQFGSNYGPDVQITGYDSTDSTNFAAYGNQFVGNFHIGTNATANTVPAYLFTDTQDNLISAAKFTNIGNLNSYTYALNSSVTHSSGTNFVHGMQIYPGTVNSASAPYSIVAGVDQVSGVLSLPSSGGSAVPLGTDQELTGILYQPGVAFASLPASPAVGQQQFCTNCVPTTASTCSTNTPASCVCKAGTGSMWAKYENFVNNGANWYCH